MYEVNCSKGTWSSNGNTLEIKWETLGYIHSDACLDADWKFNMEWEIDPNASGLELEFFLSNQQLILAKGIEAYTDQRAQEIDPLKDIFEY